MHNLLKYLDSDIISRHPLKIVNEYINDFTKKINVLYEPIKSRLGIVKLKNKILEELNLPENKNKFEFIQKERADKIFLSSILDLHSHKKDEDKILKKDPL